MATQNLEPKVDKQGREYYTVEQVMQMAADRGLPAQVVTLDKAKRYPYQVIKPQSTVEALGVVRDWRRYYPTDYSAGRSTYSNIPQQKG